MKQKENEAKERRNELMKKRQTAVMTLKASFAASQVQSISRKGYELSWELCRVCERRTRIVRYE